MKMSMQNYNEYLFCNTVTKVFSVLFNKQGTHFEMTEGNSIWLFPLVIFLGKKAALLPEVLKHLINFFIELQDTGGKDQF